MQIQIETPMGTHKREWCKSPAQPNTDTCLQCEESWMRVLRIPESAGPQGQILLGVRRACGVFW